MARAVHFLSLFLWGCAASSLLGVLAAIHPVLTRAAAIVAGLLMLIWILGWVLDDALLKLAPLDPLEYYAVLIAMASCAVIGGSVALWTLL